MGAIGSNPCLEGCFSWGTKQAKGGSSSCRQPPTNGKRKFSATKGGPASWPKTLYLVRHGQSAYNEYYEKHSKDPMNLFDADLTQQGEEEAREINRSALLPKDIELALTSPLTRAARTCLLALPPGENGAKEYRVSAVMSEHLEASCDIGRPPHELAKVFPELTFGNLDDVWWYVPEEHREGITVAGSQRLFTEEGRREPAKAFRARVDAFAQLLASTPEASIAAFAHADFFHEFLCRYFAAADKKYEAYWMQNCEVLKLKVDNPGCLRGPMEADEEENAPLKEEVAPPPPQVNEPARRPSNGALGFNLLRKEMAEGNPDLKPAEIARKASQTWKAMSQDERLTFMDRVKVNP